ncbi:hypothetical protein Chor_005902 [Crotalus horridus]
MAVNIADLHLGTALLLRTVWYELQAREWPFQSQPAEALIWQIGSGEGMKQVLQASSLGKEVGEILSTCWAFDVAERPKFTLLMEMLEKLPKLNRRLSHPGHFWKSAEYVLSLLVSPISKNCILLGF